MWKAAFSGRSETGSSVARSSSTKKKNGAGSTTSTPRRSDDDKRKTEKSSRSSIYGEESVYATAPSSRAGEPRALTESAVRALDHDEDDNDDAWEDDDKDARSERKSVRSSRGKYRRSSDKERNRSRSKDRDTTRKDSSRRSKSDMAVDHGDERAIPDMGSFEQFPGQYASGIGIMGQAERQEPMMSGALPAGDMSTPDNQFGITRADTYGQAADYYLDEGQSVSYQPGFRAKSPNMLVNPDLDHLMTASAEANPAQDTGHGSAADFYSGRGPVFTEEPQSMYSSTSTKPSKPARSSSGKNSSSGATLAAGAAALGVAGAAVSYYNSQSQTTSSYNQRQLGQTTSYNQQQSMGSNSARPPFKPARNNTDPQPAGPSDGVYYTSPPQQQAPVQGSNSGTSGKQSSSQSNSHAGLYAAGAAAAVGAAGITAYEMNQHHNQQHRPSMQSSISPGNLGMQSPYAQPPSYGPSGPRTPQQQQQMNGAMSMAGHQHFHERKGPLTRIKDGIFNLISSEEDTIKMEMYTEYIGVCKYCFDPRSSPYDAPRRHHYHTTNRRDSFEDLRKRRSIEKMRRRSREGLSAAAGGRVDKDSRYYSDRRKSGSKAELVGAGLAAAGVAAGANALFNSDGKNFDDTYSVKSGHRESSSARRRSRSSSREKRRQSSHGVVGRDGRESRDEYVVVRTKDGRTERRRVQRSRSRSRDRRSNGLGTAAGVAAGTTIGAAALSAAGRSRHSREHSPNGAFVRRSSQRSSSSSSGQSGGGMFGGFFSPSSGQRKRRGSKSKRQKKQGGGFFGFGNDYASGSDSDLAFGASRTDLSLRRKNSVRNVRKKKSDEHLAATVAGIGATAAAIAAAQKGHRVNKRASGVHLGAKRDARYATPAGRPGQPVPKDDEWEDELPTDVDDASSIGSDLAFHDDSSKLRKRRSGESIGSQSSGAGGLGAWGWRWGGKDKKPKRTSTSSGPSYQTRANGSGIGPAVAGAAAGAVASAAIDAYDRPTRTESFASSPGAPQQPMQYVDPRPISDAGSMAGSRHTSMPGAFDPSPPVIRPGPGPIQQPKPVVPIQPAFTNQDHDFDDERPKPRRTQSSPVQSHFAQDAALIGAAALGTAAVIASQRRKSKDVRFGFTEEQERKHDAERRKEQNRADEEERRRRDRERDLKKEADRHTREQDVHRARELENKRAAEAELEGQRAAQREAETQAEKYRQLEKEKNEREESFKRERERREQRERELTEEIERKRRELEDQKQRDDDRTRRERDQKSKERRQYDQKQQGDTKSSTSSSMPWGAVAAGAAAAGVGAVALAEHERSKDNEREGRRESRRDDQDRYSAQEITPSYTDSSKPVTDDDLYNRDYFNSASRSRSPDRARHVEDLARKAADKVVSARAVLADNEARYQDHVSQAEYFAPEEISHSTKASEAKGADSTDDNSIRAYSATDVQARQKFVEEYHGLQSGKTRYAPYGVPQLNLVSPTPPPSAMKRSQTMPVSQGSRGAADGTQCEPGARNGKTESSGTQSEPGGRKSSRSRSISWGVDQTHVYDVPTPESHHEGRDYMSSKDSAQSSTSSPGSSAGAGATTAAGVAATVAAGVALHEAVKNSDKSSSASREGGKKYETKEYTPSSRSEKEEEYNGSSTSSHKAPSIYQQPFYESVSDIGVAPFNMDSPGTEGAPPVQGFVEGEITEPATEERTPHIPGGFDDDHDLPSMAGAGRDAPPLQSTETYQASAPAQETSEPAWEAPLSKKDKKKRDKAAKRGESLDDATSFSSVVDAATKQREQDNFRSGSKGGALSFANVVDAATIARDSSSDPQASSESAWEPPLTKKEQKKRDKALKRGISEDKNTVAPTEEPSIPSTHDTEPDNMWEPPLSKKDKKKRDKETKNQGLADVAEAMLAAGGVAAVASTMTDTSTVTSKGTDRKTSKEPERDSRAIEPATTSYTRTPPKESSAMPGGWDSDTKERDAESLNEGVDPFQFQVHDDAWTGPPQAPEPLSQPPDMTTSKTSKRESVKFNEPVTSSPLKSEVAFDENAAEKSVWFAEPEPIANGHSSEVDRDQASFAAYDSTRSESGKIRDERQTRSDYKTDERNVTESPRRISLDDLRSVASDPTDDRSSKRRSKESKSTSNYDEPDEYDDSRSVAASEPAEYGSSRKSKRRSRNEDDDTASVTSSRTRREKDDPSSAKKAGFFGGLFGKKAVESSSRSDGAPLSRQSTRDSKDGDGDDSERRHRRRKHRSSEYGDDDDTRSVASDSRRKHRSSEYGDDDDSRSVTSESKSRRRRTRDDLDEYEEEKRDSRRHDNEREGEDEGRHHHRRRTEEGDYIPGQRHHHWRRTDEDSMDHDQSFLGMRVEGLPPLPGEKGVSTDSALDKPEQGNGNLAPAEQDTQSVSREHADAFELIDQVRHHEHVREAGEGKVVDRGHADAFDLIANDPEVVNGRNRGRQTAWDDDVEYLPALPDSRPDSPTGLWKLDTSQRPASLQQTASQGRVPIRFPFGHQPSTPGHRSERSISFGGSMPSSPASPISAQKKSRPTSSEIRPLYLVERNRKTPEVEEALPSLPSSKPSSRASSMVGSDEYESAAENIDSPQRRRALSLDTSHAFLPKTDDDYLGSEQSTPRATEFPRGPFEKTASPPAQLVEKEKPQPQFYTWEDLMKDEQNRRASATDQARVQELPELPPSRPESRIDSDDESTAAMGLAAAAVAGGAAALGYHALNRSQSRGNEDEVMREADGVTRSSSASAGCDEVRNDAASPAAEAQSRIFPQHVQSFVDDERAMEEGTASGAIETVPATHPPKNDLDHFFDAEDEMEVGQATKGNDAGDAMELDPTAPEDVAVAASAEHTCSVGGHEPVDMDHEKAPENLEWKPHETISQESSLSQDVAMAETAAPTDLQTPQHSAHSDEAKNISMAENSEQSMPDKNLIDTREGRTNLDVSNQAPEIAASTEPHEATEDAMMEDIEAPPGNQRFHENMEPEAVQPSMRSEDDAGDDQSTPTAPTITRKQSKKAKKKEKAASKRIAEVSEPAETLDDTMVQDSADKQLPVTGNEPAEPSSQRRTLSSSSGSGVAAIMADIMTRRSGSQDAALKAEALTATSGNDAIVHTSLEDGKSSATRHLEAIVTPEESVQHQPGSSDPGEPDRTSISQSESLQHTTEPPVLQPDQEEPWEVSTTISRKQSKKDKKKKKKLQQVQSESEPQTEVENENSEMDIQLAPSTEALGTAKGAVFNESPIDPDASHADDESSAVDHATDAAGVPLPSADNEELETLALGGTEAALGPSSASQNTGIEASRHYGAGDLLGSNAKATLNQPTSLTSQPMEAEETSHMEQPPLDEPTPIELDDKQVVQRTAIDLADTQMRDESEKDKATVEQTRTAEEQTPTSSAMTVDQDISIESMQPVQRSEDQAQQPQGAEEDFSWALSKQKGKKGKKSRGSSIFTPSSRELEDFTAQDDLTPILPSPDTNREADDPGTFWDAPTSKKKKGKKGKRASFTPSSAPTEPESFKDSELAEMRETTEEPIPTDTNAPVSMDNDNIEMAESRLPTQETSREVEDPDPFWEAPTSKKKKGKRGKTASIAPVDTPTPTDPNMFREPDPSQADQPVQTPVSTQNEASTFQDDRDIDMTEQSQPIDHTPVAAALAEPIEQELSATSYSTSKTPSTKEVLPSHEDLSRDVASNESNVDTAEQKTAAEGLPGRTDDGFADETRPIYDNAVQEHQMDEVKSTDDKGDFPSDGSADVADEAFHEESEPIERSSTQLADRPVTADAATTSTLQEKQNSRVPDDSKIDTDSPIVPAVAEDRADEPPSELPTDVGNTEDVDTFWAPFSSEKKGKKGKKGKAVATENPAQASEEAPPVPAPEEDLNRSKEDAPPRSNDSTIGEEEPIQFWSMKPKGKKGKKGKSAAGMTATSEEKVAFSQSTMDVDESSTPMHESTPDQSTTPAELAEPEMEADDFWAAPVKGKKGKKAKKNKRAQTFDLSEEPQAASTDQDQSRYFQPAAEGEQSTKPEAAEAFSVSEQSVDKEMHDVHLESRPTETDTEHLPPLPDSPSLAAQNNDRMALDEQHGDDTTGILEGEVSEQLPESMDIGGVGQLASQEIGVENSSRTTGAAEAKEEAGSNTNFNHERTTHDFDQTTSLQEASHTSPDIDTTDVRHDSPPPPHAQEPQSSEIREAVNVPLPEDNATDELQQSQTELHTKYSQQVDRKVQDAPTCIAGTNEDYDFAAHLARGLEDSGFDPNLVANDPTFQRRASPPGTIPEADPEELFTPIKKKKGKKGKRVSETPTFAHSEAEERTVDSASIPPSDDFNDTLEKTLAGTGFDAALLQQAASSSNDVSSNEIGGEEFNFTSSKKKKGKKAKKAQRWSEVFPEDTAESTSSSREVEDGMDASRPAVDQHVQALDAAAPTDVQPMDDKPAITSHDEPGEVPVAQMHTDSDKSIAQQEGVVGLPLGDAEDVSSRQMQPGEPTAHVTMGGSGEMDVDEQDRIYQAFKKKSKRDKKKKRLTASQPDTPAETPMEEYSDPTEQLAPAPTSYGTLEIPVSADNGKVRDSGADNTQLLETGDRMDYFSTNLAEERPSEERIDAPHDTEEPFGVSQSRQVPDLTHEEHKVGFGSLGDVVTATSAAVGMGAVLARQTSGQHERQHEDAAFEDDRGVERESFAQPTFSSSRGDVVNAALDRSSTQEDKGHVEDFGAGDTRDLDAEPATHPAVARANQSWSFANLDNDGQPLPESPLLGSKAHEIVRDSGYQEMGTPSTQRGSTSSTLWSMPGIQKSESRDSLSNRRSAEPVKVSTGSEAGWELQVSKSRDGVNTDQQAETQHARTPSSESKSTDLESSTKNRASYLFQSTPETLKDGSVASATPTSSKRSSTADHHHHLREHHGTARALGLLPGDKPEEHSSYEVERDTFSPPPAGTMSPRMLLDTIPEENHAQKRTVSETDVRDRDHVKGSRQSETPRAMHAREQGMSPTSLPPMVIPGGSGRAISSPLLAGGMMASMDEEHSHERGGRHSQSYSRQASVEQRSPSAMSNRSSKSTEPRSYSRSSNRSSTPTLRRTSLSGDLRAASRRGDAGAAVRSRASLVNIRNEAPPTPPSGDEIVDAGASRALGMSGVYSGFGDAQASQVSPTRPPSMRKRQSMHIMELESKLDQLTAENQALHDARTSRSFSGDRGGMHDTANSRDLQLREKDNEINQMKTMLQPMQDEITRLTEINNGLTEANRSLVDEGNTRYTSLQQDHAETSRELDNMRQEHGRLTSGVRETIEAKLADKNAEIQHLREELDVASEKIRSLQVQIQSTKSRDFLTVRDEDYFDGSCQKLCQHVQQWVLRFSKMSDDRVCRLSTDIKDDKVEGRLDNAILDGSDVDKLLGDRIKRRDVFMSVVMTMVWEFIFTRYLFGMDREQRQKLKALEKILAEVGPPRAVAQWRATTLTLLSRRPQFAEQKNTDTQAVAAEIFALLCMLLPPPSNAHPQLLSSLQKVVGVAVDLSVEMRTQRAEYIMLPPLQPEYDTNGDLMRKVHFNASLMNERSGMFSSNEELEESRAVVKIVLFPLVVKKGDEVGEGEEEIVVCPAQVLVHNDNVRGKKIVRVQSGAMEIDDPRRSRQSLLSGQGSTAF